MIVVLINSALEYTITIFSEYEKSTTNTGKQVSEGIKLAIAMFLNSVLTPLICEKVYTSAKNNNNDLYSMDELVYKAMTTWLCIAILHPIFNIFSISNILIWLRRFIIKHQGSDCKLTQYDANQAYEPAEFTLPYKFSYSLLMIFYTVFYLPLLPIGIVISVIATITHYFCERFLLVRICKKPPIMGVKLAHVFMNASEFALLIFLVFLLIFFDLK